MIRRLVIEFDGLPPSVNHSYAMNKKYYVLYMTSKAKEFKDHVRQLALERSRAEKWSIVKAGYFFFMKVEFEFKNGVFSDPNNMLKILIDSFEGIIFENDKWLLPCVTGASITGRLHTKVTFLAKGED